MGSRSLALRQQRSASVPRIAGLSSPTTGTPLCWPLRDQSGVEASRAKSLSSRAGWQTGQSGQRKELWFSNGGIKIFASGFYRRPPPGEYGSPWEIASFQFLALSIWQKINPVMARKIAGKDASGARTECTHRAKLFIKSVFYGQWGDIGLSQIRRLSFTGLCSSGYPFSDSWH
jgi:hypothetical protein